MLLLRHFILFSAFLFVSQVFAGSFNYKCIGKNLTIAPSSKTYTDPTGTAQDTDEWKAWKKSRSDWPASQHFSCCESLVLDGRTCTDPSPQNPNLMSCKNDGGCPTGQGCYLLRQQDLVSIKPSEEAPPLQPIPENSEKIQDKSAKGVDKTFKPQGLQSSCYMDQECESYKCENFKCVENKICREADLDEEARGSVNCEEPLTKDSATSKCRDASVNLAILGLSRVNVQQEQGLQCQFKVEGMDLNNQLVNQKELTSYIHTALKTLRGMEWLFATASGPNEIECQFALQYLRDKMKGLVEKRKVILKEFNTKTLMLESNYEKLLAAKKDDYTQFVTLCSSGGEGSYETTTAHDVALRKASGKDFLCYMLVRNKTFQKYEQDMKAWLAEVSQFIDAYNKTVFTWDSSSLEWRIADEKYVYFDRTCRGYYDSKYQWFEWIKRVKVWGRWGTAYSVSGTQPINAEIVNGQGVVPAYLNLLNAKAKLNSRWYLLYDPLLPGGQKFSKYGVPLLYSSFGNYMRHLGDTSRWIGEDHGFKTIFQNMTPNFHSFYKSLRLGDDIKADQYIYEPELVNAYQNRGCIEKLSDGKCVDFKNLMNQIQEVAFAQMLAYSYHTDYWLYNYYKRKGTLRRVLFERYLTDYNNLGLYYTALSGAGGLRDKQNICLQKVLDDLNSEDFNGNGVGLTEGSFQYYNPTDKNYMVGISGQKNNVKPQVKKNSGQPVKTQFNSMSMSMKSSGVKDAVSTSSKAGSVEMEDASARVLAARVKEMQETNSLAKAQGINVSERENELKKEIMNSGLGSASSGASAPSSSAFKSPHEDKVQGEGATVSSPSQDAELNTGNFGLAGARRSRSDSGRSQNSESVNPSGLSDEEKEMMAANYDRNKSDYKPNEEDSLFKILSKTYMRSLDKILHRKNKSEVDPLEKKPSQE